MKLKSTTILLFAILAVAAVLRQYKLGTIPTTMYIDEVAIGVDAKSIAQTGRDMHGNSVFSTMFPSYGDYKLPVYIWLAAVSVKLFGATQFAVRLPSAIAGVATVALVYLICEELFATHRKHVWIALSGATITALLPWDILFSRTGFEGHVAQVFVLSGALFALYARKNPRWWIASALMGVIGVYTYFSVRFVFPMVVGSIVLIWFNRKTFRSSLVWLVVSAAIFGALIFPLFHSRYYAPSEQLRLSTPNVLSDDKPILMANSLRAADQNSVLSKLFYHRDLFRVVNLTRNFFTHLDLDYLFVHGDVNLRHSTGNVGLMLLASAPFFFAGLYVLVRRWLRVGLFLGVWYLAALLPASVPYEVPHALRSLNGLAMLGIICGLGLYECFWWVWSRKNRVVAKITIIIFVGLFALNFFSFLHDYYAHYPARSHEAWDSRWKVLTEFATPYMHDHNNVVISVTQDKTFLWFLFYGNYDFRQVQKFPSQDYHINDLGSVRFLPPSKMNFAQTNTIYLSMLGDLRDGITDQKTLQRVQTWTASDGDQVQYLYNPK